MWEDIIRKKAPTTNKEAQEMGYKDLYDYTNRKKGDITQEWENPEGLDVDDPEYSRQLERKTGFRINPEGPTGDEGHKNMQPSPKWSKVFEGDLMALLDNIAIESREEIDSKGMISPGKQSVNKEKIMGITTKFIDNLYKEIQNKYDALMANPSLEIDDNLFPIIKDTLAVFVENTLHAILEKMYGHLKLSMDIDVELLQRIDPSGELPQEFIDAISPSMGVALTEIGKDINFTPEMIKDGIQDLGIDMDKKVTTEINNSIVRVLKDTVENHKDNLNELGAYVYAAFVHQLPIKQREMSPADTREGVEEERGRQEIDTPELTDEELRDYKFDDDDDEDSKLAALNSFTDKWMDILYKETGAETTGSKSFTDGKLGNIKYGCGCENENKKCGCN